MERRTFTDIEIRADGEGDAGPQVTLQAIKPGVVDDYGSLWKANAFDESLAQRMPTLCWAHDWTDPLGPAVSYEATRSGPKVTFKFSDFEAVPQARRAHAQVMDGTIRDCSVGFSNTQRREPNDQERSKYPGIREVIERAQLDEISLVLRGAVPGAKVLAIRSARMASGATVDADFVIDIARKVAANEMTHEEGQAAIKLMSEGGSPVSADAGAGDGEALGEATPPDPALEADALAAEALVAEAM